jgi:hypothetical protein
MVAHAGPNALYRERSFMQGAGLRLGFPCQPAYTDLACTHARHKPRVEPDQVRPSLRKLA